MWEKPSVNSVRHVLVSHSVEFLVHVRLEWQSPLYKADELIMLGRRYEFTPLNAVADIRVLTPIPAFIDRYIREQWGEKLGTIMPIKYNAVWPVEC